MNNSVQIAHNKNDLLNILDTADFFYTLHNIQVNSLKSVFYTNTKSADQAITFHKKLVLQSQIGTAFKYLGTWFTDDPTYKPA